MSADATFERRKGARQIAAEDVAMLAQMVASMRKSAARCGQYAPDSVVELSVYADELDLIVKRCGGTDGE
jgi:hypothetical protein